MFHQLPQHALSALFKDASKYQIEFNGQDSVPWVGKFNVIDRFTLEERE